LLVTDVDADGRNEQNYDGDQDRINATATRPLRYEPAAALGADDPLAILFAANAAID
jgi:hypothetical protein